MSTDIRLTPDSIKIPPSSHTVHLQLIRAVDTLADPSSFYWAAAPGAATRSTTMRAPVWVFLVQHPSGRRVLFDAGLRKDVEAWPPAVRADLEAGDMQVHVEREVGEVLEAGGIQLGSIEAVIWSHAHFDHHGNIHTFPSSTTLVVGAGTQAHFRPGYPVRPNAAILESYFEGREVKEIHCSEPTIGGYRTYDYFGDGSFFLLDAPGHCPGHLMGLARVSADPPSFILAGGDAAHHVGMFRPSQFTPLPPSLAPSLPAMLHQVKHDLPFLRVPPKEEAACHNREATLALVDDLAAFDAREDIWVIMAHDGSIINEGEGPVRLFPEELNGWKEKGWKERTFWAFLERGNSGNLWE